MATKTYGTTDRTQGILTYTTSSNSTSYTITIKSELQAKSYAWSGYKVSSLYNGSTVKSATDYVPSPYGSFTTFVETDSYSKTITKTHSSQKVTIGSSYAGASSGGYNAGGKSGSTTVTITIPAKSSYTVTFNANGGSGAPSSQTKWYGEALTLSTTKPTRTGYSFLGWSTSSSASTATWTAGGSYTTNASDTLYAVWKANTYTITYNANGGTGAPGSQTKTYGVNLTLSSTRPTRSQYTFLGWATSSTASTAQYQPSGSYTSNSAATLYAVWELAYTVPKIKGYNGAKLPTVYRCLQDGTADDEGTYANVSFSWSTFSADYPGTSAEIQYKLPSDVSWTTADTITLSGTSGDVVNDIVGGGNFDTDHSYNFRIVVADSYSNSNYTTTLSTAFFTLDFGGAGKSVAVGTAAPETGIPSNGLLTVAMDANFKGAVKATQSGAPFQIVNDNGTGNTFYLVNRTDTGTLAYFGIGSGGTNHGVYSGILNKWLIYGDASTVYVNESEFPTAVHTSTIANIITAATDITIIEAEVYTYGKLCQLRIRWKYGQNKSVPANGNISNITVGTLNSAFQPCMTMGAWSSGDQAGAAWYNITGGVVALGACEGIGSSYTIDAGTEFRLFTTYILA